MTDQKAIIGNPRLQPRGSVAMEGLFQKDIDDLSKIYKFSELEIKTLENVDKAAYELSVSEFNHYVKHEVNTEGPKIAKKYGLLRVPIKEEYGGLGMSMFIAALEKQRCGYAGLGFSSYLNVQLFIVEMLLQRWGDEFQKDAYLRPGVKGDKIFAFGLTEPEAGSDPASLSTNFVKKGNKFLLNGTKYLITNGARADAAIVFARPKGKSEGITAFIVDTEQEGFSAVELKEKIGLFTSDTAMLEFKDAEVPKENVVGPMGKGLSVAYSMLLNGRLGVASACIGVIEDCLTSAVSRARERVQHGMPIGKHQLIQRHIAEISQNLEMARWPLYYAAIRRAEFDKDPNNRALIDEMDRRTALAKKIASRLAVESADRAVQVFGGFGYSLLSPVGRHYCDSRVTRIYEGTDEILELKIAAHMLGDEFKAFE
jgi:alkylation response protein AidB-like acyl-CoA dehydrogenase